MTRWFGNQPDKNPPLVRRNPPLKPTEAGVLAIYQTPGFWRGALAARQSILDAAAAAASPDAEAMYRSEIIIADLKGEQPPVKIRPVPLDEAERQWHKDAAERIGEILKAVEAGVDVRALPEELFDRWRALSGPARHESLDIPRD